MNTRFFGAAKTNETLFDIFVNQTGYMSDEVKNAVIPFPCERFNIINENGDVFFDGETTYYGHDECSGDDVYIADFSRFTRCGSYRISANDKTSPIFRIGENVFGKAFDCVCKAFYFLRCGTALTEKYAGAYTHAACHTDEAVLWEDNSVSLEVSGGWHDAGDYGRYVTAASCALAHILYAYKFFPKAFENQNLNIPESGSVMPDILSECRYELMWLLKMQRSDGAVYHKVTTAHHAPFVMPEKDKAQLFVLPVSSSATADFCAVTALASGIYRDFDPDFSETLEKAAELSFGWLETNPDFLGFRNPEGCGTGEYGEHDDTDNRFWAYAEMFALSGSEAAHSGFKMLLKKDFDRTNLGHGSVGGFGTVSYLFCKRAECDNKLIKELSDNFYYSAKFWLEVAEKSGYGAAMKADDYCWGSNLGLMKRAMCFIIANKIKGTDEFRKAALTQLDILFGKNPLGISYVTGCGEYRVNSPHYRPAAADGIDECVPGLVSGGPNSHYFEPTAKELIDDNAPPMKCFVDRVECFSLNEVAIYWNSPTVFALAYFMNK